VQQAGHAVGNVLAIEEGASLATLVEMVLVQELWKEGHVEVLLSLLEPLESLFLPFLFPLPLPLPPLLGVGAGGVGATRGHGGCYGGGHRGYCYCGECPPRRGVE
jgi:hypothetical protein